MLCLSGTITGPGFIYGMDPRLKIIAAVSWSFLVAILRQFDAAALALLVAVLLSAFSGLKFGYIGRRLLVVNVFVAFLWLFLPFAFSVPGEVLLEWKIFRITREGLNLVILLTVKANAVALGAMVFLATSSIIDLVAAARQLGVSEKLTVMFFLMLRYFFLIHQEGHRLMTAMAARGFTPRLNRHSLRTYANLVGQLLIRSLDRADRVYAAMLCRGYRGRFWSGQNFKMAGKDWSAGFLMVLVITSIAVLEWVNRL